VQEALANEAAILVGPDRTKYPGSPLLYWGNENLVRKAEAAALDRWLAAWYFVDKRYGVLQQIKDSEQLPDDPLIEDWISRASTIQSMLESFPDKAYNAIRQEVSEVIELCIMKSI